MFNLDTETGPAQAYRALPASGRGPGVLVLHAWWGLTETFTQVCDRLAAEGFVALAPDLYQGRTAATIAEAEALMAANDQAQMAAAARAGLAALQATPGVTMSEVGTVGFSMGGQWSGLLSQWYPAAVRAMVLFYGAAPDEFGEARAAVQGHFAQPDEWEDEGYVRSMAATMQAAGREVQLYFYPGAGHWFFEANKPDAYNAEAAALAWSRAVEFLKKHLGG